MNKLSTLNWKIAGQTAAAMKVRKKTKYISNFAVLRP